MSSPKTAAAWSGSRPGVLSCSRHARARTTVPLSTSTGGRSSSSMPARVDHAGRGPALLALGEGHHPVPGLGRMAPVQRDRQPLGLDVDPRRSLGRRLRHHLVDHGGPGHVRRARAARARARRGRPARRPSGAPRTSAQERGRSARDHGDQGEARRPARRAAPARRGADARRPGRPRWPPACRRSRGRARCAPARRPAAQRARQARGVARAATSGGWLASRPGPGR